MQGNSTMEDMRNNLKAVITSNLKDGSTTEENEGLKLLAVLDLLINTNITNSYLILASCKISKKDCQWMKHFKKLIRNTKDLSYIQNRYLQVDGRINSTETLKSEKFELQDALKRLGKLKINLK